MKNKQKDKQVIVFLILSVVITLSVVFAIKQDLFYIDTVTHISKLSLLQFNQNILGEEIGPTISRFSMRNIPR